MEIEKVLDIAQKSLREYQWEIYFLDSKKLKSESQNFSIETYIFSQDSGYSIRVLKDGNQGFAYGTSFEEEDILQVIERAKDFTKITSPDDGNTIIEHLIPTQKVEYLDTFALSLPPAEKIEKAIEIEKLVKSYDHRIKKVRNASFTEYFYHMHLYNSNGIHVEDKGTVYTAMVAAVAEEDGDSQISWGYTASRFLDELDLESLAKETAKTAISLLGAKPLKTGRMRILFSPYVAAEFLGTFSSAFSGEALIKGKTFFKGMEGKQVASSSISIVDDGRLKLGVGTRSYDDEGVPTQETVLIEKGVFKGFLHNLYTAKKTNTNSTGNASRRGIKTLPSVSITNLYIQNGTQDIGSLLKDFDEVFLITDIMGLHTADPISGNFSVGASGILYSKGEEVMGVRGVTIADNFLELLQKVIALGNDLKFYGNVGSPSILFEDVMVAGE